MAHFVFAWEIGAGFGHLVPIAALAQQCRQRGHLVTVVVPSLHPAQAMLEPFGIRVVEMAKVSAPPRAFPLSINYTANLLRNGFWHSPTVLKRLKNWDQRLKELKPDLLICDHAPSALLVSRNAAYPKVAIGHGFTLPPLLEPMPAIQPWFVVTTEQLQEKDQEFLTIVNPVLNELGLTPLDTVSSLFDGVERFICIESELDHYTIPRQETYWGAIDPIFQPSENSLENDPGVFIYMPSRNRFLPSILEWLVAKKIPVLASVSQGSKQNIELPRSPYINYLDKFIDLHSVAKTCRVVITHGGTLSASIFLRNATKILFCPPDLEKAVLATHLKEKGLAYTVNWFAPQGITDAQMEELLSPSYPIQLKAFAQKYAQGDRANLVFNLVHQFEALL